jgi:hypothetical protein
MFTIGLFFEIFVLETRVRGYYILLHIEIGKLVFNMSDFIDKFLFHLLTVMNQRQLYLV